jgi:hypothetical protein
MTLMGNLIHFVLVTDGLCPSVTNMIALRLYSCRRQLLPPKGAACRRHALDFKAFDLRLPPKGADQLAHRVERNF